MLIIHFGEAVNKASYIESGFFIFNDSENTFNKKSGPGHDDHQTFVSSLRSLQKFDQN